MVFAAAAIGAGICVRLVSCVTAELVRSARARRRHLDALALLGRPHLQPDVTIVEHASLTAYCVPGRRRQVVLTSAALRVLTVKQLEGVLRHERAHLRGRHALVLGVARAVGRAFPLPVFREAHEEIATLLEMLADDATRNEDSRWELAQALVSLSVGAPPAASIAMAAATSSVSARLRRLTRPPHPLPAPAAAGALAAGCVVAVAPVMIAIVSSAWGTLAYCPVPLS